MLNGLDPDHDRQMVKYCRIQNCTGFIYYVHFMRFLFGRFFIQHFF